MGLASSKNNSSSRPFVDENQVQRSILPRVADTMERMELIAILYEDHSYNQVAMVGKFGCGKSQLISNQSTDDYSDHGRRSYSVLRQVKVEDDSIIPLQIWDYVGEYLSCFKGCILVYSVSDRNSFEILDDYIDKLQEYADCHVCKALVALHCDRPVDEWAVSREEGEELARNLGMPYLEASANSKTTEVEPFLTLANAIRQLASDGHDALGPKLLSAVRIGNLKEVDRLVSAGADVNYAERGQGCTPILLATFTRDLRLVRYLLEHGACADGDMEYGQYYKKPLHWACRRHMLDIAEELIRHGADINSLDQRGRTPLFFASGDDLNKLMEIAGDFVGLK